MSAKDDVADYWVELGKVQASMGAYGDAYYAFNRAYELDRGNPDLLRAMTEIALRSGDMGLAASHSQELSVVAPGDPWVKLVAGWQAYSESRYDQAVSISDGILANAPNDPTATELKARALLGMGRKPEAVDLLNKQVRAQPTDLGNLSLLAKVYQAGGDWPMLAEVTRRISAIRPSDRENELTFVEAALRSHSFDQARNASLRLLQPGTNSGLVSSVLGLWEAYWPSAQRVEDARRLAAAATSQEQRLSYAAFLSRIGSPADAIRLVGGAATLPVKAENAEANVVFADALSGIGNLGAAKARFDAIIVFDPGNAGALRGRGELELRTGNAAAAIVDAEKLVTVLPNSGGARLLLARAYSAAGNKDWAQRTLWTAFHDIPGDASIYLALRATQSGNPEAMNDLQSEFRRQRDAQLNHGLL